MGIRSKKPFQLQTQTLRELLEENDRDEQNDGDEWHSQPGHSNYSGYFYVILTVRILRTHKPTNAFNKIQFMLVIHLLHVSAPECHTQGVFSGPSNTSPTR
jgi:hypothetical protein